MVKAIVALEIGGPEVLRLTDIEVRNPGEGEVRLRQSAAGVNFIDVYHRNGLYPTPHPLIPGVEGVGIITALGAGVTGFKTGDRVAYGNGPVGGYAEERLIPAASLVKVPPSLKDEQVAGMMLRGLTVWYLVRVLHVLKPGETVLLHAAAGGIGLLFCQWARAIGATVIGTVSSDEKANQAKAAGCTHTINYRTDKDWVAKVRELSNGGVSVVYDGVGKDVFMESLDCLVTRGLMVTFGNASGPVPAIEPSVLAAKGSLTLTRPRLGDYVSKRADYEAGTTELFGMVVKGALRIEVGQSYGLEQAAHAHDDLEARRTTGSTILVM